MHSFFVFAASTLILPGSVRASAQVARETVRNNEIFGIVQPHSNGKVSLALSAVGVVIQKSLDTFAQRHHILIWKQTDLYDGREIWVGVATHDIAVSKSRAKTKWSHRVDPHIDRERDWIESDLLCAGTARASANIDRPAAPRRASNATGDVLVTDGKMAIVELAGRSKPTLTIPSLISRQPAQQPRVCS